MAALSCTPSLISGLSRASGSGLSICPAASPTPICQSARPPRTTSARVRRTTLRSVHQCSRGREGDAPAGSLHPAAAVTTQFRSSEMSWSADA
eukprot:5033833-Pyramimonas_sp.AAC.1